MAVSGTFSENHSPTSRRYGIIDRSNMRTSTIRKMWRELESKGRIGDDKRRCLAITETENTSRDSNEIENECPQNQNQIPNGGKPDEKTLCLHRSPSLDFPAKERVRKVFRDWGSRSFERRTLYSTRAESVDENECKRVRIETGSEIEQVHDLGVGGKRSMCRIYGRQAVLDLLGKFVKERKKEVECLLEHRFVSNFPHRHRIQALLKGRFLRNLRFVEGEKQSSVAANELGLLRQSHSVSDIRKGFLSRLNNTPEVTQSDSDNDITYEQADEIDDKFPNPQETDSPVIETHHLRPDSENMPHETETLPTIQVFTETKIQNQDGSDCLNWTHVEEDWHDSVTEEDWHHSTSDEGTYVNSPLTSESQESNHEWYDNHVHEETPQSWFCRNYSGRTNNTFDWSDNDHDSDRRFELTQLSNRRTVSNLLQSDFGPKLDNILMQSYVERQKQAFDNDLENENVDSHPPLVVPQTHEREIIDGLRNDMDTLQQRMNEMQRMLETCMDMQLQLQQSVHQQLNSAINQSSCHLCCHNGFQRSGEAHMYICSKCVEKINWSKVKESVRHP